MVEKSTTTFVIAQPAENNSKTGDEIIIFLIIGSVSLMGLLVETSIYLKKKRFN